MKLFDRRMSTGWSFVLGMFFGALLIFMKVGPSSVTRLSGHASSHAADLAAHAQTLSPALEQKKPEKKPSPLVSEGAGPQSKTTTRPREIHHPECELQLD